MVTTGDAVVTRRVQCPWGQCVQKCSLGVALMGELGAGLLSCVQITDNSREIICQVRVSDCTDRRCVDYCATVYRQITEGASMSNVARGCDITPSQSTVDCSDVAQLEVDHTYDLTPSEVNHKHEIVEEACMSTRTVDSIHGTDSSIAHVEQLVTPTCHIKLLNTAVASVIEISVVVSGIQFIKTFRNMLKTNPTGVAEMCSNLLYKFCVKDNFVVDLESSHLAQMYRISDVVIQCCWGNHSDKRTNAFVINRNTDIRICDIQSRERFIDRLSLTVGPLGGLDDIAEEMIEILQMTSRFNGLKPAKGVLLCGAPGTGKTSLVGYVAYRARAHLVTINGPEVFGSRPGQTEDNISNIFEKAILFSQEGPCILFIDEIDSLCPKSRPGESLQEQRVCSLVLKFLDEIDRGQNMIMIGATNRSSSLDPSLRRPGRLDKEIRLPVPSYQQRVSILETHMTRLPLSNDVDVHRLAAVTNGYVGADLASLCNEAVYRVISGSQRQDEEGTLCPVQMSDLLAAAKSIIPSTQRGSEGLVDCPPVMWADIGGLEDTKRQIRQAIEWPIRHPEAFTRMGLPCPRGILLYGPPGCCKTTLVRAAATSSKATFLSLSGAQLYSPFVGDSERMVTEVFQRARAGAPSIIFLDEIDSIIGKRSNSSGQRSVQERVLSTLLNEMDGIGVRLDDLEGGAVKVPEGDVCSGVDREDRQVQHIDRRNVVVVAATNRRDLLDEALVRPGRMDRILYVPPPDTKARRQILEIYTRRMPLQDVNLDWVAIETDGYTGADIESLCREAAMRALTSDLSAKVVKMEHFETALTLVQPSLSERTYLPRGN